jgi:hypothetical protein
VLGNLTTANRLGYYKIGQYSTTNKGDAFIFASKFKEDVKWHFNDDIFSSIDWRIPIDTSLTELYHQRAQQLRDKYDYVSLFYSGGVDSTNVLHAFIDNDILLDEIVTWRPRVVEERINSTDKTPYNLYSETVLAALPHLKQYVKDPRTRVRVIYSDEAIERFVADSNLRSQFNTLYNFTPTSFGITAMGLTDPLWRELYAAGKNVCHIQGADKPMVFANNNRYFFNFVDAAIAFTYEPTYHTDLTEMISKYQNHELFYWTRDLPQIVIKQCQIIKELCESSTYFYEMFKYGRIMTQDNFAPMLPHIYPPHVTEVRKVFTTTKPGFGLYSPHNMWFYEKMPSHITGAMDDIVRNSQALIDDRFFRSSEQLGTSRYLKDPKYFSKPRDTYQAVVSKTYEI